MRLLATPRFLKSIPPARREEVFEAMKAAGTATLAATTVSRTARADVPDHLWASYDFGPGPHVNDRLNQGPFGVEQDEGWQVIASTNPLLGKSQSAVLLLEDAGPTMSTFDDEVVQEYLAESREHLAGIESDRSASPHNRR